MQNLGQIWMQVNRYRFSRDRGSRSGGMKKRRATGVARGLGCAPGQAPSQAMVIECQLASWWAPDQELLTIARSQIRTWIR